jgi:hypothetical protein
MEIEVFIYLLLSMKRRRKPCAACEIIREAEGALALFEILEPRTLNVHGMPSKLAHAVMSMPMEGGDNSSHAEADCLLPERTT